jgi:hypothetical protein
MMSKDSKSLLFYIMTALLSSLILTGCGVLDQGSALVKIKCKENNKFHASPKLTKQQIVTLENKNDSIPINVIKQKPIQINNKVIINTAATNVKSIVINKSSKLINKIPNIMKNAISMENSLCVKKSYFTDAKDFPEGILGLLSLLLLILGFVLLGGVFGSNPFFIVIGIILLVACFIFSLAGISSDNRADKAISWITLIILALILGIVYGVDIWDTIWELI